MDAFSLVRWPCWPFRILAPALLCGGTLAQITERVSVRSDGGQANGGSYGSFFASMSSDGRYVAFASQATNLVLNDHNGVADVFVHDRQIGTTRCVTLVPPDVTANGESTLPALSADGRFVAFESLASDLVPGDTNAVQDMFVGDLQTAAIERVSVSSSGEEADGLSEGGISLSRDGRFVVFASWASNLAPGGTNSHTQIYLRDRQIATTELVSVDSGGIPGDGGSYSPDVSEDGRFVVFSSSSTDLVAGDTNGEFDVFVRDRLNGTTVRVSVDSNGNEAQGESFDGRITPDGKFVTFSSYAPNLAPGGTSGAAEVFVRNLQSGTTTVVSVAGNGARGDDSSFESCISPDGRFVAFVSLATNLVDGDTNAFEDLFLRDLQGGTTERIDVSSGGAQVTGNLAGSPVALSDDGRYVAFSSSAPDLVPMDTNAVADVFVRDHQPGAGTTAFTSFCDPGSPGVIACPCANPPSGPGRGCDNSAGTGGAVLSATGVSRLSVDGLVFTTSGERMSCLSILVQSDATLPNGRVYGQGVRCLGGRMLRLYTKAAVGGAIEAPDFDAGDPPVSVRSAQKGDTISGGQSRWYAVYYRDPVVIGGCPPERTFNATQAGEIAWTF